MSAATPATSSRSHDARIEMGRSAITHLSNSQAVRRRADDRHGERSDRAVR
jgi:hypothetical protein